eukprot:763614_1
MAKSSYLTFLLILNTCNSQIRHPLTGWTAISNPPMPSAEATLFSGYESSTNRIWLVGSDDKVFTYNLQSNDFTSYPALSIILGIVNAQSSVQWG